MVYRLNRTAIVQVLKQIVREQAENIAIPMMKRFDDEIVPFEDPKDPARPSEFRVEFKRFLIETIAENIPVKVTAVGKSSTSIEVDVGIGDVSKLGFAEQLDEETTDGLKIIGTIIQGIVGEYVLVTSEMAGKPVGRFGKAFLMPEKRYRSQAESRGWDPNKSIWAFSNFPGIPDFFQKIDFTNTVSIVTQKLSKALGK